MITLYCYLVITKTLVKKGLSVNTVTLNTLVFYSEISTVYVKFKFNLKCYYLTIIILKNHCNRGFNTFKTFQTDRKLNSLINSWKRTNIVNFNSNHQVEY